MFRLFVILFFLHFTFGVVGQKTPLRELKFLANQNLEQEDYTEASKYFDTILQRDSSDLKTMQLYAELLFKIKDFKKAETIYTKLNTLHLKKIEYAKVNYQLGLVKNQVGNYQGAMKNFYDCLMQMDTISEQDFTLKVKRAIESCQWAMDNINDTLNFRINKIHGLTNQESEFGHAVIGPLLIISALKCEKCNDSIGFSNEGYTNKLYSIVKENGSQLNEIKPINSNINHTSNGTFSLDKKKFYFSSCNIQAQNKKCKILVSNYKNGNWSSPDTLRGELNSNENSYTMPSFAKIQGKDYLFFCSDSKKSLGGLDIYYGELSQNTVTNVKVIDYINSIEDDITPFFDNNSQTLYFSSIWHNGFGGYDVFKTNFVPNKKNKIVNLGIPFNSSNNDTYLIKDSVNYYLTSNRNHTSKNKTCCTDIYKLTPVDKTIDSTIPLTKIDSTKEIVTTNNNKTTKSNIKRLEELIPISLYFHNDIPNPKSTDTSTHLNYLETYTDFFSLQSIYISKFSFGLSGESKMNAKEEINNFFTQNLEKGLQDLDKFLNILIEELNKGEKFELIFKGYASPLAHNDYNHNLSKRRINSVKNYIGIYKNGILLNYLIPSEDNTPAALTFKEESYGEYLSSKLVSDNPNDKKNAIYSIKAALERKVEIIGFRIR